VIGLVTRSGGIGIALREQLGLLGLGLSAMVSTGDKYDVSGNDPLMWWQHDDATTAVALYLSFGNPRKFGRLARALARTKAVADGVLHKSTHGGVVLDVRDEPGLRTAFGALADRFGDALRGVLVQPMAAQGRELLVGVCTPTVCSGRWSCSVPVAWTPT
jgi:acyl-CoA synthetase (NDP forming)